MASTVFNLGGVKVLKNMLRFQTSDVQIITGNSADPTVVAVDAVAGSLYIRSTGEVYIKNSSGSNTDFRTITSQAALDAHINDLTDAHAASAITNTPSGNLAATNLQTAVNELQSDIDLRALDSVVTKKDGTVAFTGNQSMGGNRLTSVATPTTGSDAATKSYVDSALEGLKPKQAVRVATTANITLSAPQTIDGVSAIAGNRVLVKNQTLAENNGIYDVAAGAWTRSTDFDSLSPIDEINKAYVAVQEGTANAGKLYVQYGTVSTLGTDPINFTFFNSVSGLTGGDGITVSGSNIEVDQDGQGLQFIAGQLALELDGTTLSKSAAGIKLSDTAVTPGTYGTATQTSTITVDQQGRLTAGSNTTIAIPSTQVTDFTSATRTAAVVNAINPGITNTAPSQGAVYGALLGKADVNLGNLSATAINVNLLPDSHNVRSVGAPTLKINTIWVGSAVKSDSFDIVDGTSNVSTIKGSLGYIASAPDAIAIDAVLKNAASGRVGVISIDDAVNNSAATGNIFLGTGNKSAGTGDSGSIIVRTGTSSGGIRGTINLVDGSLSGASVGYIWSLSNTTTGAGQWAAAPSGYTDEQAQDAVGTILVDSATIDFTYSDATPSITAIVIDASITNVKVAAGIDAVKLANGSVSNTEFQYLDGVTSAIQTQFTGKASTTLNNLGSTAVNANILPDTNNSRDLGSGSLKFANINAANVYAEQVNFTLGQIDSTTARSAPSGIGNSELTIWAPNQTADIGIYAGDPTGAASRSIFIETYNTTGANVSGLLNFQTGTTVNGNSGSINLKTGAVSGSGTRGTINITDASLAAASTGYVWTLANTSTGAGRWQATSSSAVTTPVTAVNAVIGTNVTNDVVTGLTFAHATYDGCYVEYRIKKGTLVRTGRFMVSTDGTNVAFNDMFAETVDSTIVFDAVVNGANINIRQTNTESGTINMTFEQNLYAV